MQVQCANSLANSVLLFYSGINCQKGVTRHIYLDFALACHLGFQWSQNVNATKTSKIQFVLQKNLRSLKTELHCNLCS